MIRLNVCILLFLILSSTLAYGQTGNPLNPYMVPGSPVNPQNPVGIYGNPASPYHPQNPLNPYTRPGGFPPANVLAPLPPIQYSK